MTRFEKDYRIAENDSIECIEILRHRKVELDEIKKKGKCEKNGFRRECLAQDYVRLKNEYRILSELA